MFASIETMRNMKPKTARTVVAVAFPSVDIEFVGRGRVERKKEAERNESYLECGIGGTGERS